MVFLMFLVYMPATGLSPLEVILRMRELQEKLRVVRPPAGLCASACAHSSCAHSAASHSKTESWRMSIMTPCSGGSSAAFMSMHSSCDPCNSRHCKGIFSSGAVPLLAAQGQSHSDTTLPPDM